MLYLGDTAACTDNIYGDRPPDAILSLNWCNNTTRTTQSINFKSTVLITPQREIYAQNPAVKNFRVKIILFVVVEYFRQLVTTAVKYCL